MKPWAVMKFGGTSVAGAPQWRAIAAAVAERRAQGQPVLVVCSALAGVTDLLSELAQAETTAPLLGALEQRHEALAQALGLDDRRWLAQGLAQLQAALALAPGPEREAAILAQGEWFSTQLGRAALAAAGETVSWVDAREVLCAEPEPDPNSKRAWLAARCVAQPMPELDARWRSLAPVLITQGFVLRRPDGGTALLGRGGSDTSAALFGASLQAPCVDIWTDVRGLYSADPRTEPHAQLLPCLGWDEALEMAASGARVIHGRSIRAAAAAGLTLWIRKLGEPDGQGTRIAAPTEATGQAPRAVMLQPDMAVLLLRNLDTRQQVGFLAAVFAAIAERGLSVDQVATSETTTTLALNRMSNPLDEAALADLAQALSTICEVQLMADCCCVSVVGRAARTALSGLQAAEVFFQQHALHMMSQSANDLSISLLVDRAGAQDLARLLHKALVAPEPTHV